MKWIEIDELEKTNNKLQQTNQKLDEINTKTNEINEKITLIHDYFNKALNLEILTALFDILQKNYIKLTAHSIQPNDLIAPHLYDLYFDGVNQYASVPSFTFPQVFTVVLSVKAYPKVTASFEWAFWHRYPDVWYGTVSLTVEPNLGATFRIHGTDGVQYWVGASSIYDEGVFTHVAVQHDGSAMRMFKNGALVGERSVPVLPLLRTDELRLFLHGDGDMHINMVTSSFLIYSRALTSNEISQSYNQKVVNASDLKLFIDPTFWDGTKYVDLSGNNNHAYPYNNPQRIDAVNKWMYIIRNYSDGYIRFLLPRDSLVVWNSGKITTVECVEPMFFDGTYYWCLYTTTYKGDSATIYIPQ